MRITKFFLLAGALFGCLGAAAPSGVRWAPRCSRINDSPALRAFVQANPRLLGASSADRVSAFRARGRTEWLRAASSLAEPMAAQFDVGDDEREGGADDPLELDRDNEAGEGLQLGAGNPLPLVRRFAVSYGKLLQGDPEGASEGARSALDVAGREWGRDNAGLVLGYYTIASAELQLGRDEEAQAAAKAGLQAIAMHPERARPLSAARVWLLKLQADALDARFAAQSALAAPPDPDLKRTAEELRGLAASEERARSMALGTPSFDLAAVVPGLEPLARWAHGERGIALQIKEPYTSILGLVSAGIPSSALPPVHDQLAPTPTALLTEMTACVHAAAVANDAGDLDAAAQAEGAVLGLINERNAAQLAPLFRDDLAEGDPFQVARKALEASISAEEDGNTEAGISVLGANVWVQGLLPAVSRRLEAAISPGSAFAVFRGATKGRSKVPMGAIRDAATDLGHAITYFRTAIALILRDAEPGDVATMREAAAWATGTGPDRVMRVLDKAEIEIDGMKASEWLDGKNGRKARRYATAITAGLGWGSAFSLGRDGDLPSFEATVYREFASQIAAHQAPVAAPVAAALGALSTGSRSAADLSLRDVPVLLEAFLPTEPGLVYSIGEWGVDAVSNEDLAKATRPLAQSLSAQFLIPRATLDRRWEDVVRLGAITVQGRLDSVDDFEDDSFVASRSLAANYLTALSMTHGTPTASKFLESLTAFVRDGADDATIDGEQPGKAAILGDDLLRAAARSLIDLDRPKDAFSLARMRLRSSVWSDAEQGAAPLLAMQALSLDDSAPISSPSQDVVSIAFRLQSDPSIWDDVAVAYDASRLGGAGRAIRLRALVGRAGPEAQAAYADLLSATAGRRRCSGAGVAISILKTCSLSQAIVRENAAKSKLYEALGNDDRSILFANKVSAAELRAALKPGELVLSPMVVGNSVVTFEMTPELGPAIVVSPSLAGEVLATAHVLEASFRLGADGGAPPPDMDRLEALYRALVKPSETRVLRASHILWAPDPSLASIPVAALRADAPFAVADEEPTPYLGLARPLSVSPSFAGLVLGRKRPPDVAGVAVAFGGVPFTGAPGGTVGSAPTAPADFLSMARLPLADRSLGSFAGVTRGLTLSREQATLAGLRGLDGRDVRLLMFYTHGINARTRGGPALVTAPNLDGAPPLLGPAEIMQLKMRPAYVLLAACSTGEATDDFLQPYGGVVQSFFALGARAVLSAQRPVDQQSAAGISEAVVRAMEVDRVAPSEALRRAQRSAEREPDRSNPAYWAQLIWVGDGN